LLADSVCEILAEKQRNSAHRESEMAEIPSARNSAQSGENPRNSLGLNYKSAALPAELCRRRPFESRFREFIKTSYDVRAASRITVTLLASN
jgi:hypothetical protein